MLSPNPLSLFCALLLCFPLAIFFTTTTAIKTTSPTSGVPNGKPKTILLCLRAHGNFRFHSFISLPSLPEDDASLLRLASRVKSKSIPPRKIAFMFLTTSPLPFAPLWEAYFNHTSKDLFNIYVDPDPSFQYDSPFTGVFANRVIHSKPAERNTPTLVSAARRLLTHTLLNDPSNSMFALLSPACVPLHSFNFTYRTLVNSRKRFIEKYYLGKRFVVKREERRREMGKKKLKKRERQKSFREMKKAQELGNFFLKINSDKIFIIKFCQYLIVSNYKLFINK